MRLLTQTLKDGAMSVLDVPLPALQPGTVLVRNHYSVISTGTEGRTVRDARLGYLGKARARKKEVDEVIASVKSNGLVSTYNRVMNKLEAPSTLGYSCAGEVIAVADDVEGIVVGDHVACAGATAVHAEVVAVPKHLCAKVSEGVDLRHAAFTAIASIALQGVRQAELDLGSNCVVIGLGLVGLLTVQMLQVAGVQAIGIDIDPEHVTRGTRAGCRLSLRRDLPELEEAIRKFTRGAGTDAVIITAGTSSNDPIELAGRLCRHGGRVVVVGDVPTGFSREHYYKKELSLRMSCSYGPGRYDAQYEERGIDYPIGHVRWTANRNMQSYLDLLGQGKFDVEQLITHTFPIESAPDAYQMILDRTEPVVGVLLEYDTESELTDRVWIGPRATCAAKCEIGFIGAGAFAQNILLPAIKGRATLRGVATARPNSARHAAAKFGFEYCTGEAEDIMADEQINTVFVVTRHNLHAPYVLQALKNHKHVFVEKPLCMSLEQLEEIREIYEGTQMHLMVGFNRRFAPYVQQIKRLFSDNLPKAINYRVNAGKVQPDHWVHDSEIGGGRIVGEVCHFVDVLTYLVDSRIDRLSASAMDDPHGLNDTLCVNFSFEDGSTASLSYFSNGHKQLAKEHMEVYCGGRVAILDDFRNLTIYGDKVTTHRLRKQDKGHQEEIIRFIRSIEDGTSAPISFDEIYHTTRATFRILDALKLQQAVSI